MKILIFLCRLFAGLVFIFSGFVKVIDVAGFAIKLEEYLLAFHMEYFVSVALPIAIIVSATEMMIGLNLVLGLRMKFTVWLLMIFMSGFTLLTLILAITNPVSDCGCFGDAVKITNWQTFGKNIILLIPTLVLLSNRNKFKRFASSLQEWILVIINFIMPVILSVFCIIHLPVIDFRPYKIGTHIPDKMSVPDGAPTAVYETLLIYEKDGVKQEFVESNYPWQDTTWKWVETKQNLISKGYEPPIHDFSITNAEGIDITQQVLTDSNYVFLIIAPKLEHAAMKGMHEMNELAMKANNLGFHTYCLTSSTTSRIDDFRNAFQPVFELCTTDETTLKTIIRANPGVLVLREGNILGKWNYRDAPDVNKVNINLMSYLLNGYRSSHERSSVFLIAFFLIIFYCLVIRFSHQ